MSFVVCAAMTNVVRRAATRYGLVDLPDGKRKLQKAPVALGGGIALLAAFLASTTVVWLWPETPHMDQRIWLVVTAGALITAIGVADDRRAMRAGIKLIGQLVAAAILVSGGIVVRELQLGSTPVNLGWLAAPITVVGLVVTINAMNLLDGADGVASGISAVMLVALACIATLLQEPEIGWLSLMFASAALGVLWHNAPPARIYLGDAGSMLLGLVLGSLTILATGVPEGRLPLLPVLAIWTIPILDLGAAILRRRLSHHRIFEGDRGHIHHCMRRLLGDDLAVLRCLLGCVGVSSLFAIGAVWLASTPVALAAILGIPAVLVVSGAFGRRELRLLAERLSNKRHQVPSPAATPPAPTDTTIRVRDLSHKNPTSAMPKTLEASNAPPHICP